MSPLRALVLLAVLLAGCSAPQAEPPTPATPDAAAPALRLEPFADGFTMPVLLVADPHAPGTLLVAQQDGLVYAVREGARDPTPWLNLSDRTRASGEQGYLGLALHPDQPGVAYASYTDLQGDSVLSRYHLAEGREEVLLQVDQPYANHNGGHVLVGPDGMLWYGLGDGGSAGDPEGNGQNPDALLGSLLRLDVSRKGAYGIPADNPYANGGGRPEIWAKGLRNPWRFTFDRATGDLWIGDVGQNRWEEIDFVAAGAAGGVNFGWNAEEGTHTYGLFRDTFSPTTKPVAEYSHDEGCSVTGGYAYRGTAIPALEGVYLFGDYCSGTIWTLTREGDAWRMEKALDTDLRITSFGEDAAGELYVVDHGGRIMRLVAS